MKIDEEYGLYPVLGFGGRDPALVLNISADHHILQDQVSDTDFSQTYAGTNRTMINAAGELETVPANTIVVDRIGTSLVPAIRLEPKAANILLGTPPTTQDVTLGTGSFTLQVSGAGSAVSSAGTATITGAGTALNGTPNTFTVTVGGTVHITITTATVVWLIHGSIPSSYFAGAAAIGSELITDGSFAAVTEGAELSSGLLTIGNCYKITARTDGDFVSAGAPDNNVNTYFNATATGVGLLDAGDKVKPITFTNWTAGNGWAPQATAGALTGKAQKVAGTASYLLFTTNGSGVVSANTVYRFTHTATASAGAWSPALRNVSLTLKSASGIYNDYIIAGETDVNNGIYANAAFVGTIDDVSVKEHGTVRASEAGTTTAATDTALSAALAASGSFAMKVRFPFAKTQVTSAINILAFANSATSFLYIASNGVITLNDGTNTATNDDDYSANTDYIITGTWNAVSNEMAVGIGEPGAISEDAAGVYDGSFTDTGTTYLGHTLGAGVHIYWLNGWNTVKDNAFMNTLT